MCEGMSTSTVMFYVLLTSLKECSSAKRKELFKQVQVKAAVSSPVQLLLDMKVWWSLTYVMVNCAESSKEVRLKQYSQMLYILTLQASMLMYLYMRWASKSVIR